MYARLYISILNQGEPGETSMDWARMRASLEDLTRRYPSKKFKNLRASYACFARDKNSFTRAMAQLEKADIDSQHWIPEYSYEACTLWAQGVRGAQPAR